MKCLGLEHTVDMLGEAIQKPVKRVTFSSVYINFVISLSLFLEPDFGLAVDLA